MIDARGQSCPIPVLMVQKAVKESPSQLEVMVDNNTAVENITRFAQNSGYKVSVVENDEEEFTLTLSK